MRNLLLIVIVLSSTSFAAEPTNFEDNFRKKRDLNRRAKYPLGINAYALGPFGIGGVSIDYFIVPKVSLEVGAGLRNFNGDAGFIVGGRYHFFGNSFLNLTPYVGAIAGIARPNNQLDGYNLYLPVGIQRIKKNRITWSVEVAYQWNSDRPNSNFYGGGKLGIRI